MTLPHDTARCPGVMVTRASAAGPIAAALFPDNRRHSECAKCRRREPGHPERQPQMGPPQFLAGKCPERIEP